MRHLAAPTALLALVACGGSSPTTSNPPPSGNPPASVAVQAGDAQQAEPGAVVAIKPAVIVRDASGQPVSEVAVSFAVDSGGGSLTGASATTGSNGIATVANWTLGTSEGRNVLRVTVGTLAPVKIAATAMITGASFPPATLGVGGGSITVLQPGPLNGFKLDVPSGAYAGGLQATVRYASNVSIPRSPTVNPVSPLITISTTADYATTPLTIHIVADIPTGTFPVIMMYDPASGAMDALTTTEWDAHGVTAITGSLNGAHLLSGASLRANGRIASLADPGAVIFVDALPLDVIMRDYDSGYRPGVDDWEFPRTPTEIWSTSGIGSPATSLWYFNARPSPQKLNGRFQLTANVPLSDRMGIRWTSIVGKNFDIALANAVHDAMTPYAGSKASFLYNQFLVMRAKFAHGAENGGQPRAQLIAITNPSFTSYLIVYRVQGDRLYVADPVMPGDVNQSLQFSAGGGMSPYTNSGRAATPPYDEALNGGLTTLLPLFDQLPATYAQVAAGTIGDAEFPTYEFHGWAGRLYDTLFLVDTLRWWIECAQCKNGFATTLSPSPANNIATSIGWYILNPFTVLGSFPLGGFLASTNPPAGTEYQMGLPVASATSPHSSSSDGWWLDWHKFVLRRLQTSITPAAPTGMLTVPLKLKHQATLSLLPASVRYRWDFGDGKPKVTLDNNPNIEHIYEAVGTFPVTGEIIDLRNDQVIARATETATITLPHFIWVFQTVNAPTIVNPPGGIGSEHSDTLIQAMITGWMTTLRQTPSSGQVEVLTDGTCKGAVLNMPTAGGGPGPTKAYFGANCPDPDFVQSFTMGTLGSGTVTGSAVATNADPNAITVPGGSINAAMTGPTLSGTIVWLVRYSTGIATYTFTFQAIQTLPVP